MKFCPRHLFVFCLVVFVFHFSALTPVFAAVLDLYPVQDAYVDQREPDLPHGTDALLTGFNLSDITSRYALVKFDVSGIPYGSVINVAKFTIYPKFVNVPEVIIRLIRINSAWTEGVKWTNMPTSTNDFSTSMTYTPSYANHVWEITDWVKKWKFDSGNYPNYGFYINTTTPGGDSRQVSYYSRESGNNSPKLQIVYDPPVALMNISNVTVSDIRLNSVKITWTTNQNGDSWVKYGLSDSYGSLSGQNESVTNHSVTLSGLNNNNTYHFKVQSKDAGGNGAGSADATFKTLTLIEINPQPTYTPTPVPTREPFINVVHTQPDDPTVAPVSGRNSQVPTVTIIHPQTDLPTYLQQENENTVLPETDNPPDTNLNEVFDVNNPSDTASDEVYENSGLSKADGILLPRWVIAFCLTLFIILMSIFSLYLLFRRKTNYPNQKEKETKD